MEIREVPMEGDRLLLTAEEVLKRCDANTIGVIVTLGVTFTLQFEPVHAISLALDKLEELRAAKSKKKAPQLQLLLKEPSLKLSPLNYYPLFDFYFSKISDAAIKENWRFTSNFASNPCVTNVKL